jgi:BioD-like phosphotransacetylase family protein
MPTTIQLNENVKKLLDRFKTGRKTYEEVIIDLMHDFDKNNRYQKNLLIESCKIMTEENLKISKEFELIENLENWEW